MEAQELLKSLNEKLGGLDLAFDETKTLALEVDGMAMSILDLSESGALALTGLVGRPPPEDDLAPLYRSLLEANYTFSGAAGSTLSVNPESGDIELCRALPLAALDGESFFAEVERFVNMLETWGKIVADYRAAREAAGDATEAASFEPPPFGGSGFMQV